MSWHRSLSGVCSDDERSSVRRCATHTVDDAPANEDVFGSHEPIADALHELITAETGGRTIGLEGGWGSGKSTIVRLLDARLDGSGAHVVVFDAWAHEGDPLRRSFLETLIKSISAKGWIEAQPWGERRAELARRRHIEHTRPVSRIERPAIIAGAVAALFAILVPLGVALIQAGLSTDRSWAFWVGVAVYVVPVALIAGGMGWLLRGRSSSAGSAFLSLLSVESVTESKSETIETPDPTSVEFESTFRDLMRDALGNDPERRLVLVVDNLDRVYPDDARSIWATLQTFLHHSHESRSPWLDSLWVLLPYDRDGIARLWDESATVVSDKAHDATQPDTTLADSFIDKSIQVRFDVPLPLLSDWRTYLESTLQLALPDCDEADDYTAYRLYAHRLADSGRAPRPRELKQYINRIGALHRLWQHELPFASLTYYASLGTDGVQVADRLRHGTLPESGLADLLDDDVDAHLAAIAFNTDPERARQLLLGPLLERALTRDTSDELLELLDRPGFWEALLQAPIVQPGSGTPVMLKAATRLLDVPEPQRPHAEWSEITSQFAQQGLAEDNWPPLSRDAARDLSGLLSLVPQGTAAEIATRVTTASIPEDGAAAWADGARALLGRFEWLTVHASGPPEAIFDALAHFATLKSSEEQADRLRVDPDARGLLDEVIASRIDEQQPAEALKALNMLQRADPSLDWNPFVEAAGNGLRFVTSPFGEQPPTPSQLRSLLEIIVTSEQHPPNERDALVKDGIALACIGFASEQGDDDTLGDWLYEEFRQFTFESWTARSHPAPAAVSGKNLVDALLDEPSTHVVPLARAIERRRDFSVIASIGRGGEGEALAAALVAELWPSERFTTALNGDFFRNLWPHIARAGASSAFDTEALVREACRRPTFVTELKSAPFAENPMGMYTAVIAAHPKPSEAAHLAEWAAKMLSNLNLDQWRTAMTESGDWVALLGAVRVAAPSARIGGAFGQALAKLVEALTDEQAVTTPEAEQWELAVVPLLAPAVEGTYLEGVARAAVNATGGVPEAFFALVGDTLRQPRLFFRSDILNGLLPSLITERNMAGLSWLIEALQSEEVRNNAPAGAFDALAEVVSTSHSHDEDDDQPIRQIATLISPDRKTQPDE